MDIDDSLRKNFRKILYTQFSEKVSIEDSEIDRLINLIDKCKDDAALFKVNGHSIIFRKKLYLKVLDKYMNENIDNLFKNN